MKGAGGEEGAGLSHMTYRWREGVVLVHGIHVGVGHLDDGRVLEEKKSREV